MEMELQFEHIDWNDIVEAELSGDQEALEVLRNRSIELKRSFSLPSPSPPRSSPPHRHAPKRLSNSPQSARFAGGHFKVPRKHRRPLTPRSQKHQLQRPTVGKPAPGLEFQDLDHHYPALSRSCSLPHQPQHSSPSGLSYAEVALTRSTKRTASERLCLSPIESTAKRSATSDLIKTPTELGAGSRVFSEEWVLPGDVSTPQEDAPGTTEDSAMDGAETGTPANDSRPVRAAAVQRRLFAPAESTSSTVTVGSRGTEERLTDLHRLGQRQKQIDFGKNTPGYACYLQALPKWKRQKGDPVTPDKHDACSTRSWQGRVRVWRRNLHKWDPPTEGGLFFTAEEAVLCDMDMNIDL